MTFYAWLGVKDDKEEALNWLEKDYQGRSPRMYFIKTMPEFDFLRAEPRFKALLKKIGLPEVFDQYGQLLRPLDD